MWKYAYTSFCIRETISVKCQARKEQIHLTVYENKWYSLEKQTRKLRNEKWKIIFGLLLFYPSRLKKLDVDDESMKGCRLDFEKKGG